MKKITSNPRKGAGSPAIAKSGKADQQPDRRKPTARKDSQRSTGRPASDLPGRAAVADAGRPSHPEDAAGDSRLAHTLEVNAGRSAIARHRDRVTGIENEEDGVPDDEDALEDAAQAEMDGDGNGTPGRRPLP
jgi:hypothetical protein